MIGWTLGRYFFTRYITITVYFFLGICIFIFLLDFTGNTNRLAVLPHYTIWGAVCLSAMHVPFIIEQMIPFMALFSAMSALISLNRKYELVVARSIGVSAWQFLLPVCVGAFLVGLVTIFILNPIAAYSSLRASAIESLWRNRQSTETTALREPWLRQKTDEGETIIGVRNILNQGKTLIDATFIMFNKDKTIKERYDARTATLEKGYWELRDVTRFAIAQEPRKLTQIRISTHLRPEFIEEKWASPDTIPIYELHHKIQVARSFGYSANAFDMHFQSLLAMPALLVTMTLIAATVTLRFVRFGQSGTMILGGVLSGFMLYVITSLVKAFGAAGFVPPSVVAWTPVLIAAFFGIAFLLHKEDG